MRALPTLTGTEARLLLAALESVLSMRPEHAIEALEETPGLVLGPKLDAELSRAFDRLRQLAAAVEEVQAALSIEADRYLDEDREAEYQRLAWPEEP